MNIVYKSVDELIPYEKNTKKHDKKQIKNVATSIDKYGFVQPLVIDKNNVVIIGHCRLLGAKQLKMEKVPCVCADDLTEEEVNALRIVDNKSNESEWDMDILAEELGAVDLSAFDFDFEFPIDEVEQEEVVEDEAPEIDEESEPIAKFGEVWQLGRHRLMCGDSTSAKDVQKLMGNEIADLVVTDPPYNVAIENSKGMTIENDDMESEKFQEFLTSCFTNLEQNLKCGGAFYIWYASREHINFEQALNRAGLRVREQLIWNKNTFILGRQDYHWKHEPCLYGWKDGEKHYFIDDRTQSTVFEDKGIDVKKLKKEELIELVKQFIGDKCSTTIINEDKPSVNDLHPTMKPIKLIARLVKNSSKPNEIVLDLFGGSGSTLITCEQLNRKCLTMEYDPKYCDAIINRWETFTGEKAMLISK